ncbi:MAG: FecR domain-containing protein [Rhodocyclaceae bacterium]
MTSSSERDQLPDVLKDAQAWVRKLTSGAATEWEARAFRRWRDADPAHLMAFREAARQWHLLEAASGAVLQSNAQIAREHRGTVNPSRTGRRAFLGAALGGAAAAGVAAVSPLGLWPDAEQWGADYRTAVGEQLQVALGDEVSLTLNTRTSVRRTVDAASSGVEVIEGEAAVDVNAAPRPFRVLAGSGRLMATDASFDVRHAAGRTCVTCTRGRVRIDHPAGQRVLERGHQAIYERAALDVSQPGDLEDISAWRRGELVFRKTPLPTVVDEINRYRKGRVVLVGETLRGKTVTARIRIPDIETALVQIQYTFDLRARALPAGILILS